MCSLLGASSSGVVVSFDPLIWGQMAAWLQIPEILMPGSTSLLPQAL